MDILNDFLHVHDVFAIFLLYLRIKPSFSTLTQTLTNMKAFLVLLSYVFGFHAYRRGNLHKSKRLARNGALQW